MNKIDLQWKFSHVNRGHKAQTQEGIYFIYPIDNGYILSFQGERIAKACGLQALKDWALIDLDKRRNAA